MKYPARTTIGLLICCIATPVFAVKTSHWVHTTQADFDEGQFERVVATNLGDLKLSRQLSNLLGTDARVSAVFAMAQASDGTIYAGCGPEGTLLAVKDNKVTTAAELGKHTNIFSLLVDSNGKLLVGTGGDKGQILRIDSAGAKPQVVFEEKDVQYIWSMVQASDGTIYAATGPNGQLFSIDTSGGKKVLFDSDENNLLSLISDGADLLYVGTDPNGLVYRVNRKTSDVFVVYDAPQSEISALAIDSKGNLYAGTSQANSSDEAEPGDEQTGRPEDAAREAPIPVQPRENPKPPEIPDPKPGEPLPIPRQQIRPIMLMLQEAEPLPVGPATAPTRRARSAPSRGPARQQPDMDNSIYRVDSRGFVTEIFKQSDNVLAIVPQNGTLLVGTGGDGNVYLVNPDAGETLVLAKVDSKDVMCLLPAKDGRTFMGLANAGEIAAMSQGFAGEGTFTSPALDAGQISLFGKIQLRGTLPAGTNLKIATRSGNVADSSDPGWSKWSQAVPAAEFVPITSPTARFFQYRLSFTSDQGRTTPAVEEISVAYQVPNQSPQIKSIKVEPTEKEEDEEHKVSSKMTLKWESDDPNEDDLQYSLYFRSSAQGPWVLLKDKLADPTYDMETRNVGDGRYEIKVEASDAAANPVGEGKTASRVSDPILVDNTPPLLGDLKSTVSGNSATIALRAVDRTGTVAQLEYSVDSTSQWQAVLPVDNIADSPEENYQVKVEGLSAGAHQITLRATDARGNRSFESVTVTVER